MSTNCFRESTLKRHSILYENCIEDMKIPTLLLAYSSPYTLVKSIGLFCNLSPTPKWMLPSVYRRGNKTMILKVLISQPVERKTVNLITPIHYTVKPESKLRHPSRYGISCDIQTTALNIFDHTQNIFSE